jgi:hypothetical protein
MEHDIVNKYSDMIAEEVNHYKNEMLEYFHAREIDINDNDNRTAPNTNRQFYTTSIAGTTYQIEDTNASDISQKTSTGTEDGTSTDRSVSYDANQAFITEDTSSVTDVDTVPFYKSFKIPSNLAYSIMFK